MRAKSRNDFDAHSAGRLNGLVLEAYLTRVLARTADNQRVASISPSITAVSVRICSRAMNYVVLKSFGEIDPARAFAKLTHERMETLPIARADHLSAAERASLSRLVR